MIDAMITSLRFSSSTPHRKLRSILISSIGMLGRRENDEYPVPKSSTENRIGVMELDDGLPSTVASLDEFVLSELEVRREGSTPW